MSYTYIKMIRKYRRIARVELKDYDRFGNTWRRVIQYDLRKVQQGWPNPQVN